MSKTAKSVISCLVVVLIFTSLVGVLGFASKGFKDWNTKNWFQKEQVVEKPATPPAVVDGDGNDMTEGKVYDMPANMVFGSASPASVGNAITINAVVTPANASVKDLTWAINWQNPASTWATGKAITDYFTLTPNGQQSNISCLQAFGEKIVISVTSVDNPAAKAECVVNFAKRISNVKLALKSSIKTLDFVNNQNVCMNFPPNDTEHFVPEVTYDEGIGTISTEKTITVNVRLLQSFTSIIDKNYYSIDGSVVAGCSQKFDIKNGFVFNNEFFSKLFGGTNMSGENLINLGFLLRCANFNSFLSKCRDIEVVKADRYIKSMVDTWIAGGRDVFVIEVICSDNFSANSDNHMSVYFSVNKFLDYAPVSSVSLSDTNLQF